MKKPFVISLLIVLPILLGTSCGSKDKKKEEPAGDPKAMVVRFFEKLLANDFDTLSAMITVESAATLTMMRNNKEEGEKEWTEEERKNASTKGVAGIIFGEPVIDGDMASVKVEDPVKGSKANIWLKKVNGKWRINLNKAD